MARSYNQIELETGTAEGAGIEQRVFSFTFDYINSGDIKVIITNNPSDATPTYTAPLPLNKTIGGAYDSNGVDAVNKKIILNADPDATAGVDGDSELRIYRATTQDPLVDFQGGSRVAEADLDNAYRQGLFAAQEVSENASTTGVAGANAILTTDTVQLAHMTDDSVDSAEIVDGAIDTAHIALDAVGEPQLATTLDLSSHAVTLNSTTLNLSGGNFGGTLAEALGGTGLTAKPSGSILECVTGPCVGKTQAAVDGGTDHTLPDAGTAGYAMTSTYADIPGSIFKYRAPLEANKICYELNFSVSREGAVQSKAYTMFRLYLGDPDDVLGGTYYEVPLAKFAVGAEHHTTRIHFKWTFPINDADQYEGSGAPGVGHSTSWGPIVDGVHTAGHRHIKLMGREIINGSDIRHSKVNGVYLWDDTGTGSSDSLTENTAVFSCPVITVTAIK